ncbi:MAG: M48 family metallopeptidase [Nitrospiria bacterium]
MKSLTNLPRNAAIFLVCFLCFAMLFACRTTPVTGRSQLIFISEPDEIAMGLRAYKQVLAKATLSEDPDEVAMVRRVGKRIAAVANQSDYRWEFNLIKDDKMVNAFALPGGKVAVYTGILPITRNETGLATVLSHEVSHAIARHGGERMTTGLLTQLGMAALEAGLGKKGNDPDRAKAFKVAYGAGAQLGLLLPFSRRQELEADRIGLILMAKAGYNPKEAVLFWERMSRLDKKKAPEFLSTHPSDAVRIQEIRRWLPEAELAYSASLSNQEILPSAP